MKKRMTGEEMAQERKREREREREKEREKESEIERNKSRLAYKRRCFLELRKYEGFSE